MATAGGTPIAAPALARTYAHRSYDDPWECVQDYLRVIEYTNDNPFDVSTTVANALDLPRGRVQSWMDGSRPNCVRGIRVAEEAGWLDAEIDSPAFRGLNVLVAWVLSGGSIGRDGFVPTFVAANEHADVLHRAADLVGISLETSQSQDRYDGAEFRPTDAGSVLGRVLHVLGAPLGRKNRTTDLTLPAYLDDAPDTLVREFTATYVVNRGTPLPNRGGAIQVKEDRSGAYLDSLAGLFQEATGRPVTSGESGVYLDADAAGVIDTWPTPLADVE